MTEFASGALNSVVFWEAKTAFTQRKSAQPFPNGYHISSLSWNSTNTKLAVVPKWGDRIAVCDFRDDIMTWSFLLHKDGGNFTCGSLLHNHRYLVSGCGDSSVLIWDLKNKNIIKNYQGHSSAVTSIARSSNDHLVVSGSHNGSILMHTVSSSAAQHVVNLTKDQPLNQVVNRLRFSLVEKSQLGSVTEDGVVCLWSVESQRMLMKFSSSHTSAATDLCFAPSNNMLMMSVGMDAKIKCYDIQSRKLVTEITAPVPLSSVIMLRDGHTLVGGGADGKLYVYALQSLKTPREVIDAHQNAVTCIAEQSFSKSSSRKSSAKISSVSKHKSQRSPSKQTPHEASPEKKDHSQTSLSSSLGGPATTQEVPSTTSTDQATVGQETNTTQHSHLTHPSKQQLPQNHIPSSVVQPQIGLSGQIQPGLVQWPSGGELGSVTPFITSQQPAKNIASTMQPIPESLAALNIQTPFSFTKGGEAPVPLHMTTPAFNHTLGHTSGIFSPLEGNPLSVSKVTASVAPTVRGTPIDTHSHPLVHQTSATKSDYAAGMSGLFSPIDSHTVVTPHSVAPGRGTTNLGVAMKADSVEQGHARHDVADVTSQQHGQKPAGLHMMAMESTLPAVNDKDLAVLSHEDTSILTPSDTASQVISTSASIHHSDVQTSTSLSPTQEAIAAPIVGAPPLPPGDSIISEEKSVSSGGVQASTSGIQMQFLENRLKDLQEDIWYSVHRDIRALSVDMFKQFFAMQQQSAAQFNALHEKVERLTEENKRLQEMVHQYMPKH